MQIYYPATLQSTLGGGHAVYIPESVNIDTARIRKMELVVEPMDWLDSNSDVKLVATVYDLEANK